MDTFAQQLTMKPTSSANLSTGFVRRSAFSLIEVVMAIGIFLVTVLALVGLLGPTLQSVDEVEKTDEISSVVNTLNAFLQSSPDIAPGASKFNAIYNAVAQDGHATVLIFRAYDDNDRVSLRIGFSGETDPRAQIFASDVFAGGEMLAAGPIYRAVLTPSSVNPSAGMTETPGSYPRFRMNTLDPASYPEGYFAMEVRIFAERPSPAFEINSNLAELANKEPTFTYNTAIVR